jgi:hypothetical protein
MPWGLTARASASAAPTTPPSQNRFTTSESVSPFFFMVVLCGGPVDRDCLTLVSWRERDHVVPVYDAVAISVSSQSHNTTSKRRRYRINNIHNR